MDNEKWQLEGLFKRAFERTKERFVSYLLTWVVSFGIGILIILLSLLAVGVAVLLYVLTKSVVLTVFFGIFATIVFYFALVFSTSWISLATVSVLVSEEKLGAFDTLKKVKPLVWGYFWMSVLIGLFFVGLLPWGVLTLGVVLILWSFWATFATFVYLTTQKKGLQNLWVSRQMFLQRAWGIFGRLLLVNLGFVAINMFLSMGGGKNGLSSGLSFLFGILASPFLVSFSYEIFKNLDVPNEVKKPRVWVVFSVLGWILTVLLFVGLIFLAASQGPALFQKLGGFKNVNKFNQKEFQRQMLKNNGFNQDEVQKYYEQYKDLIPTISGTMRQ